MQRIAHRGAKREFPENTIPAFLRAFERGADAVELDVHATADGKIVVHHDPAIGSRPIADATWSELREVEIARGIGIPRLEDVLAITPEHGTVYVEIKGEAIERHVANVIAGTRARCAVHSFDHDAIMTMRDIAPDLPRGVLFDREVPDLEALVRRTGARDVWPQWTLVDEALVRRVHALGARVIAWTVNDRAAAASLAAMGLDGLCGDDVRVFDDLDR